MSLLKRMCLAPTKGGCKRPPLPGETLCSEHIDLAETIGAIAVFDVSGLCTAKIDPPCDREVFANGLCDGHLKRKKRGLPVDVPLRQYSKDESDEEAPDVRVMTRVSKKAGRVFERRAQARETSSYELARRIIEWWAELDDGAAAKLWTIEGKKEARPRTSARVLARPSKKAG